jgi:hypothetical protein
MLISRNPKPAIVLNHVGLCACKHPGWEPLELLVVGATGQYASSEGDGG